MPPDNDRHIGKEGRRWFPVSNGIIRDDRILTAGEPALVLFIAILGHISEHQRRGVITRVEIEHLGLRDSARRLDALVRAGLLEKTVDDIYWVPAWEAWNTGTAHAKYMRDWRARQKGLREVKDDPK